MRKYTNKIIEMVDEGFLNRDTLISDLLMWMSEDDVKEFFETQDFYVIEDEED